MIRINPAIFLGLTENFDELKEFKEKIKSYTSNLGDLKLLVVCVPASCSSNVIEFYFDSDYAHEYMKNNITPRLNEIASDFKVFEENALKNIQNLDKYLEEFFQGISKIYLTIPSDKQLAMKLGKLLQDLRKQKNICLVGIGNISHQEKEKQNSIDFGAVKDFDAWIRVKIFEFDYYAIRDFENYYLTEERLVLDDLKYYIPFLFIFGTYFGTDELLDLYARFDNYNSLRSFVLQTLENKFA